MRWRTQYVWSTFIYGTEYITVFSCYYSLNQVMDAVLQYAIDHDLSEEEKPVLVNYAPVDPDDVDWFWEHPQSVSIFLE